MWAVSADLLVFAEALAWFRARSVMSESDWQELAFEARVSALRLSNIEQADLINDVFNALVSAIEKGTTLEAFQEAIGAKLISAWAGTEKNPALRIEKIFRTNIQRAYNAGRYKQMTTPVIRKARPYWMFDAIMDNRISDICEPLDGVVRPASDPWWATHTPPLHHYCRSSIRCLTDRQAKKRGITDKGPDVKADTGFGKTPKDSDWTPDPSRYPPGISEQLELKLHGTT